MNDPSQTRNARGATRNFELERFLPYRLSILTNTISEGIARSYRDRYEISVAEWRVIAVLGHYPGLSASEVAARTAMDKVTVSRAVSRLAERGMLHRESDPSDRRRQPLHLTPGLGQAVLGEVVPQALAYERGLLNALSESERDRLHRLLEKLLRAARVMNEGTSERRMAGEPRDG